jgi:hypothetical protein
MKAIHVGSLLTAILLCLLPTAAFSQSRLLSASERREARRTIVLKVELADRRTWGTSEQGARQNVLKKAQDELAEWLRKQSPYYSFKPSLEFIERELLRKTDGNNEGVLVKVEEVVEVDNDEKHRLYSAQVDLHLTPEVQDKLRKEAERFVDVQRAHEAWSRQWPLFKGLLLLVAIATAVGGYFNLDDRTQGYYSKPLSLVAAAVVLAAGYVITLLP